MNVYMKHGHTVYENSSWTSSNNILSKCTVAILYHYDVYLNFSGFCGKAVATKGEREKKKKKSKSHFTHSFPLVF